MRDIPRVQWMIDDVRELMHWIPFEDNGDDVACDEGPMIIFASGHIDRVEISPRHLRFSGWLVQGPKESCQRSGREVNHAIFNSRSRRAR